MSNYGTIGAAGVSPWCWWKYSSDTTLRNLRIFGIYINEYIGMIPNDDIVLDTTEHFLDGPISNPSTAC